MMNQQDSNQIDGASPLPTGMSSSPGGKPNSVDVDSFLAALDDPRVADALARRLQSTKDRRIAAQEKQLTKFQEDLERLERLMKEEGLSRSAALRFMALEDRLDSVSSDQHQDVSQPVPAQAKQNQAQSDFDVETFLKAVGIDPNDPEVTALYRNGGATPDALVRLVTQRKSGRQPNVAQVAPAPSGQSANDDLMAQYNKEVASLPPGSSNIFNLRDKYRRLGLSI